MVSHEIQTIIDSVKTQTNSLERNKIVSHLEDAKAWAIRQEVKVPKSLADTAPPVVVSNIAQSCICPLGATDASCPVHG